MTIVKPWIARFRDLIWPWRWCLWIGRCAPTVILVRHADVTPAPGNIDPPLNAAGLTRAGDLRHALQDAGVSAIFVTRFQRTRQTAEPLATLLGLTPIQIDLVDDVVAAIQGLPGSSTVLVVGHSNTAPAILTGLGGPPVPAIGATEFDRLLVWTRRRLVQLRYGA